jgi:hypothetical protein
VLGSPSQGNRLAGAIPYIGLEPISKMRLSVHGGVTPMNRDYTSIFMKIKECIKPIQNARILACMLHFRIGLRLALNPNPPF